MNQSLAERVQRTLRDVPDFPNPGILFRDITPLFADVVLLCEVIQAMYTPFATQKITHVFGIESRGFLFGVPIALALECAFVPARKPGKLPWKTLREAFSLEYGSDVLEVHIDAFGAGARVLVVDDILATGGTAAAACRLVEGLGAEVTGLSLFGEIVALDGRARLGGRRVEALMSL